MSDPRATTEMSPGGEIQFRDAAPALELICWTVIVLAPFLRWVNGPAVSTDQFVTQITVLCVAIGGALGLRIYNWRTRRALARARDATVIES